MSVSAGWYTHSQDKNRLELVQGLIDRPHLVRGKGALFPRFEPPGLRYRRPLTPLVFGDLGVKVDEEYHLERAALLVSFPFWMLQNDGGPANKTKIV